MGSEWDDNLFRSDSSHEDTMGRITSRKIERPTPQPSIPPPKVKRYHLDARGMKRITLEVGKSVMIGRDIIIKNNDLSPVDIVIGAPLNVVIGHSEVVEFVE